MTESYRGYQSLSHSKWDCNYHVAVMLKKRCKALFRQVRRYLGEIFMPWLGRRSVGLRKGIWMSDYVHVCIALSP